MKKHRRKKAIDNKYYIKENTMMAESSANPDVIKLEDVPASIEDFKKKIRYHDGDADDDNVTWTLVMRTMDKYLFYIFLFLMIIVPIIIAASLDTSHLGDFSNILL